jgi:hypothetical protein
MNQFRYPDIERQIVEALPEIRSAAEFYWKTEGEPGKDCGPYIFFEDLFARYVEILLWLPSTPRRDELLRRAFEVVEEMLGSIDGDVQDLASIGLYEGRDHAWLERARPFIGSRGRTYLNAYDPQWSDCVASGGPIPEMLDGYHVRAVIARELQLPLQEIPGVTYITEGPKP